MAGVDERLERRFQRIARPIDAPPFDVLDRRRRRGQRRRAIGSAVLAVTVVAGSIAAFAIARSTFSDGRSEEPAPIEIAPVDPVPAANGVLTVSDGNGLYTVDPATGTATPVTGLPDGIWHVAYSPDGARLALTVFPNTGPRELWVTNPSSPPERVARAGNISRGSWSPDGAWIAYAADTRDGSSIHLIRSDGTGDRVVGPVLEDRDYFSVSFAPDGGSLLFDAGTDVGFTISTMSFDGTDVRQLSRGHRDHDPSWSPDGSRIAFTRQEAALESDIFLMDADGSNVRRLTDGDPGDTNHGSVWAPDGTRIAYQAGVTGGPGPVWLIDPDGRNPEQLLDADVVGVAWQPLPVEPGPSASPDAERPGVDVGLGTRLCDVQRLGGIDFFGDDTLGTAWTGSPVKEDGRCSRAYDAKHVVAVDHEGDGAADSFSELPICTGCEPHDATDLGGDGTLELVVLLQFGSTPEYGIFDVVPDGLPRSAGVYPIVVEPPGARRAGLPPGDPVILWAGGDEGFSAAIRCEGYPQAPELTTVWSLFSIPEAGSDPNATEEFHETRLRLEEPDASSASFVVLETSSGERPVGEGTPLQPPARACGVVWTI